MNQILIVYDSPRGQTEKIARYMRTQLMARGLCVKLQRIHRWAANEAADPGCEAIIVGASVHMQTFSRAMLKWVIRHRDRLQACESALFTVSLNASDPKPQARIADQDLINQFRRKTGWDPGHTASLAGALHYTQYGPFLRWFMKRISRANGGPVDTSQDHELTDWSVVDRFIESLGTESLKLSCPVAKSLEAATSSGLQ